MFEDLLVAEKGEDTMLLCVFFVAGNYDGLFEKYRQLRESQRVDLFGLHHVRSRIKEQLPEKKGHHLFSRRPFAYSSYSQLQSRWTRRP
jgi:hypothetical protein